MKPWMWLTLGAAVVGGVGLVAWLVSPEAAAGPAVGSGAIALAVAQRGLARAKVLREEAAALDAEAEDVDDGPSSSERFERGEVNLPGSEWGEG